MSFINRFITKFTVSADKKNQQTFFDLPAREQKKIIKSAASRANDDQRKLVDAYRRQCSDSRV